MSAASKATTKEWWPAIACVVVCALGPGCSWLDRRAALVPTALPDLSRVDPAVQAQARERYDALTRKLADQGTPTGELAAAYGQYGMVLHAADYFDAAEPCYVNA
jgi:hypothetical protein